MENDQFHKLTTCLLVYNHDHLLEKVITNILEQSFSDFKLIISDDCSTDNSYLIAKRFESLDNRVEVIKTPSNLGMAGNANYAIGMVASEFVALLHHDDLLKYETFAEWLSCIESNTNIAFVFNDYKTSESISTNSPISRKLRYINPGKIILKKFLLKRWGSPVRGTAIIRKKYFDEAGGMHEKFGLLADVDLWMRLAARWDVGYINKPLINVLEARPDGYPKDYTEFSWKRLFLLFDIHSSSINQQNYSGYLSYLLKRFVFRNNVSFEIIKWHLYALIKRKKEIIKSFPDESPYELFYSKIIRLITRAFN